MFHETRTLLPRRAMLYFFDPPPTLDRPGGFRSRTRVLKIYRGPKARLTFYLLMLSRVQK